MQRFGTMSQSKFDALAQNRAEIALGLGWNIPAQDVTPQRQRHARPLLPPFAQIDDFRETRTRIRQLPFVNDEACVGAPILHRLENLVERNDDVIEFTE